MTFQKEFLKDLTVLSRSRTKRVSSWDRTGANKDFISLVSGEKAVLADLEGSGCINHMYFTQVCSDRHYLRKLLLRMHWDGESEPSVEVPFGDFFGLGHCRIRLYTSLLVTVNQGAWSYGFNTYFPMPFSDRAHVELINEGEVAIPRLWYHIDYEEHDRLGEDIGRFHAQWQRQNPCKASEMPSDQPQFSVPHPSEENNYIILEAKGQGHLAGLFLNVDNIVGGWWGEGDDMIFIDGEKWPPSLHGTGTEEIFGGGACPNEEYAGPYTGFHLITSKDWAGKNSMYRFFVNDPIRFSESIRVTIEHGHANNLANDYSSVAFWYQTERHEPFPRMLPAKERVPRETPEYSEAMENLQKAFAMVWSDRGRIAFTQEERLRVRNLLVKASQALDYDRASEAQTCATEALELIEKARQRRKQD